jgi:O-antigen/teichoic acid export membrane protein
LEFISRSLGGVLEAGQRFEYINGLNLFTTVGTFAVYGVCIMFDYGFTMAIYGLFLLRAVTMGGNWLSAFKVLPNLIRNRALLKNAKEYWKNAEILIRYGFWISVGSVIGPLLIYFDQWVISIIAGISFLPYYTIPFNLLGNLGILPGSLSSTLFPAFSAMAAKGERGRCEDYFLRAHRFLLCTIVPVIFIIFSWSWEILDIWIGNEFANEASSALRILSIGFGISLMAPLSGALLQAIGRPDLLVKLYLWELPFNILSVWFLTSRFGISGAAVSFCLRALVETTLLWILVIYGGNIQVRRFLKEGIYRPCTVSVLFVIAYYIKRFLAEGLMEGMLITLITIIIYCLMIGFMVLDESEKKRLRQALTKGRA